MLLFISVSLLCVFLIIRYTDGRDERDNSINTVTDNRQNVQVDERIDIEDFVVVSGRDTADTLIINHRMNDDLITYHVPMEIDSVIELIGQGDYEQAMEILAKLEEIADSNLQAWVLYYKAHIFFLQKKYTYSRKYFEDYLDNHPNHELVTNAQKAVEFISGWY